MNVSDEGVPHLARIAEITSASLIEAAGQTLTCRVMVRPVCLTERLNLRKFETDVHTPFEDKHGELE